MISSAFNRGYLWPSRINVTSSPNGTGSSCCCAGVDRGHSQILGFSIGFCVGDDSLFPLSLASNSYSCASHDVF